MWGSKPLARVTDNPKDAPYLIHTVMHASYLSRGEDWLLTSVGACNLGNRDRRIAEARKAGLTLVSIRYA